MIDLDELQKLMIDIKKGDFDSTSERLPVLYEEINDSSSANILSAKQALISLKRIIKFNKKQQSIFDDIDKALVLRARFLFKTDRKLSTFGINHLAHSMADVFGWDNLFPSEDKQNDEASKPPDVWEFHTEIWSEGFFSVSVLTEEVIVKLLNFEPSFKKIVHKRSEGSVASVDDLDNFYFFIIYDLSVSSYLEALKESINIRAKLLESFKKFAIKTGKCLIYFNGQAVNS
ncbi:MAG: hypothetical protein WCW61_02500 [Patescibacteria group bacterium]